MLVIMNKLELVKELRRISEHQGCRLSLRAALAITDWLKQGTPFYSSVNDWLQKQDKKK